MENNNLIAANTKRKNNIINKSKTFIDEKLNSGFVPKIKLINDDCKVKKLEERLCYLKREAPIGNEHHIETIELRQIENILTSGMLKKSSYRLEKENTVCLINKTEYEYAINKKEVSQCDKFFI